MVIRVGIIGASTRGWAQIAHIPALRSSDRFRVSAVATRDLGSARKTADSVGAVHAFDDPWALATCDDVDLVVVTVKVADHAALVDMGLQAGKHIFCEWPLGRTAMEAEELLLQAERAGVRHVVGLQGRFSSTITHLRELIADNYVGEILSCSVIGSGLAWGATTDQANAYLLDARSGATMLHIPVGHFLDTAASVLGTITPHSAMVVQRRRESRILETGAVEPLASPDQIIVTAKAGEVPISIHYRGGLSRGTNLRWEINGTHGDIVLTAPTGHIQMSPLSLCGARKDDATLRPLSGTAEDDLGELPVPARNVRRLYDAFFDDLRNGTRVAPTFEDAVSNHRLLHRIAALTEN